MIPRIAITPGEPAGIGPELVVQLAQEPWPAQLVVVADPALLAMRAVALDLPFTPVTFDPTQPPAPHRPGEVHCAPVSLAQPAAPGQLNPANADYVLATLERAVAGWEAGDFQALVTGPVHKGVINDAGHRFSGHTEWLAQRTGTDQVVMLLTAGELRVALATTHLPLKDVPAALTQASLRRTLHILHADLVAKFGLEQPRILVTGLNPHAGESGHLGREEIEVIEPVLAALRAEGMDLVGPLPADTLFTPRHLADADAVLAMYHDQGLPVLKHAGFGRAVNVTLGLPLIRTSVDHGTALDLAGRGQAEVGSLQAALQLAIELAGRQS